MAITVIAPPDPKDALVKKCDQCGVTLQFYPVDIQQHKSVDYTGDPCGHDYIKCPNCEHKIVLKSW